MSRNWKIAGGVIAAVVAIGALSDGVNVSGDQPESAVAEAAAVDAPETEPELETTTIAAPATTIDRMVEDMVAWSAEAMPLLIDVELAMGEVSLATGVCGLDCMDEACIDLEFAARRALEVPAPDPAVREPATAAMEAWQEAAVLCQRSARYMDVEAAERAAELVDEGTVHMEATIVAMEKYAR